MLKKFKLDGLDIMSLMNGLVFFAPVALLVRTQAGMSKPVFFLLQALLSIVIFMFEIPTGKITDRIGYRNTIILSQSMLCLARILLFLSFVTKILWFFMLEAVIEGLATCFSSGTQSAYLYSMMDEEQFVAKSAHIGNCGTIGFLISTVSYAGIYSAVGMRGLLLATCISSVLGLIATTTIIKETKTDKEEVEAESKHYEKGLINSNVCLIVIILSCVSLSFILINFFYVDKLIMLGYREELLTPIILGYSAVQLLSEKILVRIPKERYIPFFSLAFIIAGASMVLFGMVTNTWICFVIMLVLPLSLDVPAIILDEIQNKLVDSLDMEEKRAELLSIFNMGVNLLEIVFLFCSAILVDVGISFCFMLIGIVIILMSILFYIAFNKPVEMI